MPWSPGHDDPHGEERGSGDSTRHLSPLWSRCGAADQYGQARPPEASALSDVPDSDQRHALTYCIDKGDVMTKGQYIIVRTYSAGVFAGTLVSRKGQEVELKNARRLR